MRPRRRGAFAVWAAALAVGALTADVASVRAQDVGDVGGRVVDAQTSEPVEGVLVSIDESTVELTNARGVFVFSDVPAGPHSLTFEHIAYGQHTRSVSVEAGGEVAIQVRISAQAIELGPLVVETLSELEQRRLTSGHSINEIGEREIELADRSGMALSELLQTAMPGVLVRPGLGAAMCVQYRAIRTGNNRGDCDGVSVVLDGVPVADPSLIYASLPLRDIARLEMLSPGQAGVRYGMRSGQSVLLVETKRGEARRQSDLSMLVTGFDWSEEPQPYRWLNVFGGAFLANAAGVGLGLALADHCFWTPDTSSFALRTRCRGAATAGASLLSVVLPAVGGSIVARWGGQTSRSKGRVVPAMITSGMILTGGYLMLIGGEGATRSAGIGVLAVGVPLTMTLSDRIFRILRLP